MLNNIPKIISPELMLNLMKMGHGDTIILADANFPAYTVCDNVVRLDGVEVDELLEAILNFFPVDDFISKPVTIMDKRDIDELPEIWEKFYELIGSTEESKDKDLIEKITRQEFYDKAKTSFIVVQTGTSVKYANIMLSKGVCK